MQGLAEAQHNLALMYYEDKYYEKAFEWFEKAAAQGHAEAQQLLGTMYHRGEGVPKDAEKAHKWFEKSANFK